MNFPDVRALVKKWPFRKWWKMTKADKIREVAARLGVSAVWLDGVIAFETAGTYDPQIKNPNSSARGLIQFVDKTARGLGFADSLDLVTKLPDFDSQMDNAVYPYLKNYAPFLTEQDLYMSVFYPAYRRLPADTVFPDTVREKNPGINTPQDYINHVNAKIAAVRMIPVAGAGVALLVLGVAAWWLMKGRII